MAVKNEDGNIIKQRPAEITGVASAVAVLVAKAFGLDDPDVILALAVVIGFVPAVVTFIVATTRG